jgi:hypothetical protein
MKFYVERCGLGVDDAGQGNCATPLVYACTNPDSTDAQLLPVVNYLLSKGASTRVDGCRSPWKLALENGKGRVHDFILERHRKHQKPLRIASNPASNGFDADEVAGTGGRRKTKKSGKKKRKPRWRKTEPVSEVMGPETEEAYRRREYEEAMQEMKETYKKEIEGDYGLAEDNLVEEEEEDESGEIAAGLGGLALDVSDDNDNDNDNDDDDDVPDLVDDFVDESVAEEVPVKRVVPSEYMCPISFHIMTSPVIAMDGHSYEQSAIEEWVSTCIRKKLPVTSPFTSMPMTNTLIPNLTLRNLIRSFCDGADV